MNDDQLIEQLRSALDEATAGAGEPSVVSVSASHGRMTTARWMAVAAAVVLIGGATTALIARNDRHRGTTAPATTDASTTTIDAALLKASWYTLATPGLVAGPVRTEACCLPRPAPGPATVMAWGDVTGIEHGLLVLTATPQINGESTVAYAFSNMTNERAAALEAQVVPGSGLPYVLPDPSVQLLGFGMENAGSLAAQTYTSGGARIDLTAGDYRGQLAILTTAPWHTTTIAGVTGYRVDDDLGSTFIWHAPGGTWVTLHIDIALSRQVDEIVAGLRPAPLPTFTPTSDGNAYQGSATIIDAGTGPMLAFVLDESLPPQGGDLPLLGFDWSMVPDEQTVNGTTWGGPYTVTGIWDGAHFFIKDSPTLAAPVTPDTHVMTAGCTLETMAPMLDALGRLDLRALHIVSTSSWNYDGHCGVKIVAAFDTPELRSATAKVGSDVTLEFVLHVVQP